MMKGKMAGKGQAEGFGREYLCRLGRYLPLYFPQEQALDILKDYQAFFSQEGLPEREAIRRWGSPRQALDALLAENPGARGYCRRHLAFWGAFLLLALFGARLFSHGLFFALLLLPVGLLGITRAPAQRCIERQLPPPPAAGRGVYLAHALLAAAALLLETGVQWLLRQAPALPAAAGGVPIGLLLSAGCLLLALLSGLLLGWMLWRALSVSIGYLAGACHALGAIAFALGMRGMLCRLDSLNGAGRAAFGAFSYYGIGLLLALLFWGWMQAGRRR